MSQAFNRLIRRKQNLKRCFRLSETVEMRLELFVRALNNTLQGSSGQSDGRFSVSIFVVDQSGLMGKHQHRKIEIE